MIICDKCVHKMYCIDYGTKTDKCKYFDQITNEEWFCQLPTEEKAKWLENKMTWAAQEQGTFTAKGWVKWLKQPHK